MKWLVGAIGALALAATSPAAAQETRSSLYAAKIAVRDFQKSIEFYTALGMNLGTKHNSFEWELQWDDPAQGSKIIMVHDETDRMHMVPGGAFLMVSVPDVNAVVTRLRSLGFDGIGDPVNRGPYMLLMMRDPDGNQIELLGRAAK